ncbi:MAG TPA: metallophosphoesterase family protein [Candidatus Cybelea sp.]|nr:metallophosphoesterase family protein [Candidatus Cybelea sp.]
MRKLLDRLFSTPTEAPAAYAAPAGCRIYAIGDIHGRADLLQQLRAMVAADARAGGETRNVVVYLGDYVDRGPASREVIDTLIDQPMAGCEEVFLLGNHEQAMLQFLSDVTIGPSWMQFGGWATLRSYGIAMTPTEIRMPWLRVAQEQLNARLPPRHLAFLRALKLTHAEGGYLFVHAGLRPGVALDAQNPDDLIWIRDEFLNSRVDHGKVVVHGHSISDQVEMLDNRIGVDTGAYFTGRLSCVVLEASERRILQT